MKQLLLSSLLVALLLCGSSKGDLIFEVSSRSAGPITIGTTAIFDVSLRSDPSSISNLGGVTFFLGANDPNPDGGKTEGGIFRLGTNDSSSALASGRTYIFTPSEGGFLNSDDSFVAFSASGVNRQLTTTGGYLGSIELDTTNAIVGDYQFTFTNLDGIDSNANTLAGLFQGDPFNYSIVAAVPEPTSLILLSFVSTFVGLYRATIRIPRF